MTIIAISGTHCAYKTTFAHWLCLGLRTMGKNATVISEVARECPLPIHEGQTLEATEWIVSRQIQLELEAEKNGYDYIICDRGVLDPLVYYMNSCIKKDKDPEIEYHMWLSLALMHMTNHYNHVIEIVLNEDKKQEALTDDGFRRTSMEWQKEIDQDFKKFFGGIEFRKALKIKQIEKDTVLNYIKSPVELVGNLLEELQ